MTEEQTPRPAPLPEANGSYIWNDETKSWDYYIVTTKQGTVKETDAIINK